MHLTRILYFYSYRTFIPYDATVNVWRRTENEEREIKHVLLRMIYLDLLQITRVIGRY